MIHSNIVKRVVHNSVAAIKAIRLANCENRMQYVRREETTTPGKRGNAGRKECNEKHAVVQVQLVLCLVKCNATKRLQCTMWTRESFVGRAVIVFAVRAIN